MDDIVLAFLIINPNYKSDIIKMLDYLAHARNFPVNDPVIFQGITTDTIIDIIDYYVSEKKVYKTKSKVERFASAISTFFIFAINKGYLTNTDLFGQLTAPPEFPNSYKNQINRYIIKSNVEDPRIIPTATTEQVNSLLDKCDSYIPINTQAADFDKFAAAICLKLMILLGLSYRKAKTLLIHESINLGILEVGEISVRLPTLLASQIRHYYVTRMYIDCESQSLFVSGNGKEWGKSTPSSKMTDILKECELSSGLIKIQKFGVKNLIEVGVDWQTIKVLTDVGDKTFKDCLDEFETENDMDFLLNSKLSSLKLFYRL